MIIAGGVSCSFRENNISSIIGHNDLEFMNLSYNQEHEEWINFPANLQIEYLGRNCVVISNRLVFIEDHEKIYELLLDPPYTSKLLPSMLEKRFAFSLERFNDNLLIIGGKTSSEDRDSVDSVLMYDLKTFTFTEMAPLPFAVNNMTTVTYGDSVILIGETDKNGTTLNTVVMYNVKSGRSTFLPAMKSVRNECTAVATGNVIVVLDGNKSEYFSFDTYMWEELPPMNEPRYLATSVVKNVD